MVDDDRSLREALRRALSLGGYEVQLAEGGQQGLSQVAPMRPTSSCSTSACPTSTGSRCAGGCATAGNRLPVLMLTARDAVDRPDRRPRRGCRRLPRQAVRRGGAEGAAEGAAAPRGRRRRAGWTPVRGAAPRHRPARRDGGGPVHRADANGVPAAGAADAEPGPRPRPQRHLRPRLGLRLRPRVQRAARVRRLPAAQARGGGRAALIHTVRGVGYVLREP